jgi:conjugative transposon TraM protein
MVNQKLEELYRELDRSSNKHSLTTKNEVELSSALKDNQQLGSGVDRLEEMMLMMQESSEADPEMQQIESVLEKILDIQYPERVKEKIREKSLQHSKQVFPVEKQPAQNEVSLLAQKTSYTVNDYPVRQTQNGFYGLENETLDNHESGNAIEAVIHDTQELMAGSTVKMRLLNDVYVNGRLIPKDQFIYGTCNINGERLIIDIESIRTENSLFPVSLSAYDLDGLEGIYIPGAIARDVAKQSTNQAIQGMEFFSLDPSVSAQATNAGIQAAKTLLSKKAKAIKVTVKAGYKILLYDANAQS